MWQYQTSYWKSMPSIQGTMKISQHTGNGHLGITKELQLQNERWTVASNCLRSFLRWHRWCLLSYILWGLMGLIWYQWNIIQGCIYVPLFMIVKYCLSITIGAGHTNQIYSKLEDKLWFWWTHLLITWLPFLICASVVCTVWAMKNYTVISKFKHFFIIINKCTVHIPHIVLLSPSAKWLVFLHLIRK